MSELNNALPVDDGRRRLQSDCANCFGLCCVALPFAASADFPTDKEAGTPCANLRADFGCGIHARLRGEGFTGCTVFECFGAGQKVSQATFAGEDWRQAPGRARQMFDSFAVMRQLHELLWYLTEAVSLEPAAGIRGELQHAADEVELVTEKSPDALAQIDVAALRQKVNALLLQTSELVRATVQGPKKNLRGADLMGAKLRGADLRGANLRGAYLIAADLRNADIRGADLIGADFRNADVSGADFTGSLFLTQAQLNAARGDSVTKLPHSFTRPAHWAELARNRRRPSRRR